MAGARIIERRGIAGENNAPGAERVQRGYVGDIQRPAVTEDGIAGESRRRPLQRQATRAVFSKGVKASARAQQTTGHECVTVTTEGRTATRRGIWPVVVSRNRQETGGTIVNYVSTISGQGSGQDIQAITITAGHIDGRRITIIRIHVHQPQGDGLVLQIRAAEAKRTRDIMV